MPKEPPSYFLIRWLFIRWLGIIYFLAFASLGIQILGLLGHNGILPIKDFLEAVKEHYGSRSFWLAPSVFWINASDTALVSVAIGGSLLAILLVLGFCPLVISFLLWLLYLSITTTGQEFLGFQWDALLLETGFLGIFFAERHFKPRIFSADHNEIPSIAMVWVFRFVLFKLIFSSGVVKLTSGDTSWRDLTALTYHYMTQPLPNPLSWFVYQWPAWAHKLCTFGMFFVELIVPFFIFLGRTMRSVAFVCFVVLQMIILLTGNYCFFNLLTIVLCLFLLDDDRIKKFLPKCFVSRFKSAGPSSKRVNVFAKFSLTILAGLVFLINLELLPFSFGVSSILKPIVPLLEKISSLRSFNRYGLFAVMTTNRHEIIFAGSHDGREWKEYEFRFKPGQLNDIPKWAAPHQPRLDWQMWFAALGGYRQNLWVIHFMQKILQNSKPVLDLLGSNPFKDVPPKYIRAVVYDYTFTDPQTRKKTGQWWTRKLLGLYCPVLTLK